nr:gamma-glutamyl hydrolase 2 isoform X3 [Arachis hypogaea]
MAILFLPLFFVFFNSIHYSHSSNNNIIILQPTHRHHDTSSSSCPAPNPNLYYQPVIGIVTHPGDGASGRLSNSSAVSNIPASYVKFVEAGGARVVPLVYNESPQKLLKKLDLVNGVLFTGGWAKDGQYFETVRRIFKKVLERNDGGEHFPLYAICLGFELITMIVSGISNSQHTMIFGKLGPCFNLDNNILEEFSASDQASALHFVENADIEGSLFQSFPPDLLKKLSTDCVVMQNHHVYVSTMQSRNYPVTAFQWHPEKNAFEWGSANIPHTEDAIRVTHSTASFLVSEARKSSKRPDAQEVRDNLIYNYSPTYVGKAGKGYDEVYLFR